MDSSVKTWPPALSVKIKLISAVIFASATMASANLIPLGSVTFTGDFTLIISTILTTRPRSPLDGRVIRR